MVTDQSSLTEAWITDYLLAIYSATIAAKGKGL